MRAEDLLGLEVSDDRTRTSYELSPHLARIDGALYGGTALGASLEAFEVATGRPALWCTTQFSASTRVGARIDQQVEVLAEGRNVAQVRLTGSSDGQLLYSALGATAFPRTGPAGEATGTGPVMPAVPGPDEVPERDWPMEARAGFTLVTEYRDVPYPPDPVTGEERPGRVAMWARLLDSPRHTPASLAFLADMVPMAIMHTTGIRGAGTSLDNTLRIGHLVDSEWVLLDLEGHIAHDGYGHGLVHIWSADGVLMATGSQTSPLLIFGEGWPGPR